MTGFVFRAPTDAEREAGNTGAVVLVGDLDVSSIVSAVEFGAYAGEAHRPGVTLNLMPGEASVSVPDAEVHIDPTTSRLLVRLGWTPPKETR